jgi:hypothetical protein
MVRGRKDERNIGKVKIKVEEGRDGERKER